ncbi:MAG TPA: ABC transporter permease, partial [Thermoanaerobaculia bacterium]
MRELLRDVRYGVRMAWRAPAWSAVAIGSLALGIGANTAVFTLLNALFLRPLPLRAPAELVEVFTQRDTAPGHLPVSFPNYEDFRDHTAAWSSLAAFMPVSVSVSTARAPVPLQLDAAIVTGNFFDTLGVLPGRGRLLRPQEDKPPGAHPVVVLSDGLWHRRFAADPGIVGQAIEIDGQGFTVVGVAAPGFSGLSVLNATELWVPVAMHQQILPSAIRRYFPLRRPLMFSLVGRLRPGIGLSRAEAEMRALAAELARRYPDANEGRTVSLLPLTRTTIGPDDRSTYLKAGAVLMAVVALVLLVACANVANLLLARAAGRRREMALRLALGARRAQLLRQLFAESLVLALAAGVLGLLFALWTRRVFVTFDSPYLPAALDLGLDGRVLAFSLAVSLGAALLFGLVPAAHSARVDLTAMLKDAPAAAGVKLGRFGLHDLLIVVQMALSLVCVIGTALFLLSLRNAGRIDPGFERENLLVLSFDLDGRSYQEAAARPWLRRVVERVAALPGVRSAAVAASVNLDPNQMRILRTTVIEGRGTAPEDHPTVHVNIVGPGYFATLGIPIQRGRGF